MVLLTTGVVGRYLGKFRAFVRALSLPGCYLVASLDELPDSLHISRYLPRLARYVSR